MASLFSDLVEHSGAIGDKQCAKQSMNEQGIREALPRGRARQAEARENGNRDQEIDFGFRQCPAVNQKTYKAFLARF